MKKQITIIAIGIILLIGFVSAEVIKIDPKVLESFSIYSGESITQNITIKTDGNYLVYLYHNITRNTYNMEGFYIDYDSPIRVNKEKIVPITLSTAYNFSPDSFTIHLYASTKAEEILEIEFIQNETIEINDLELNIDSNGTGNITIKTFLENPLSGFGIPALNKFFEIETSGGIEQGMNKTIIKIHYTDDEVNALGIDENTLRLYFYNETTENWQQINSWVDTINNIIYGETTHFSIWGIFGEEKPSQRDVGSSVISCSYNKNYDWECGDWGECAEGIRTRECKEYNNCRNNYGRPSVTQSCIIQGIDDPIDEPIDKPIDDIVDEPEDPIGKSRFSSSARITAAIVFVLIVIIMIIFVIMARRVNTNVSKELRGEGGINS